MSWASAIGNLSAQCSTVWTWFAIIQEASATQVSWLAVTWSLVLSSNTIRLYFQLQLCRFHKLHLSCHCRLVWWLVLLRIYQIYVVADRIGSVLPCLGIDAVGVLANFWSGPWFRYFSGHFLLCVYAFVFASMHMLLGIGLYVSLSHSLYTSPVPTLPSRGPRCLQIMWRVIESSPV